MLAKHRFLCVSPDTCLFVHVCVPYLIPSLPADDNIQSLYKMYTSVHVQYTLCVTEQVECVFVGQVPLFY